MQLQHPQKHRRRTCERQGASAGIRSSGSGHFPRVKREYGSGERTRKREYGLSSTLSRKYEQRGRKPSSVEDNGWVTKNDCEEDKAPIDYEEVRAKSSLARRRMLSRTSEDPGGIRVVGFGRVSEASSYELSE